jgi:hypothetical protein
MDGLVQKILIESNWFLGRKIDINEMEKFLENEGYIVFDRAKEFLGQFGLLKITFNHPYSAKHKSVIKIDTRFIPVYKSVVDAYNRYYKKSMVPVAHYQLNSMVIYIAEDGMFYGGFDESIIELGGSFEEALYNLVHGIKLEKVLVKLDD